MPPRPVAIASRHPRLRLDRRAIARAFRTLDAQFSPHASRPSPPAREVSPGVPPGEISLVFLTDAALARLHADFLDDPAPTDVITFPGDPALGTAGEICISVDAALRHLKSSRLSALSSRPAAFSAELTLYLVHGWLHLAGYDDRVPAQKRVMRRAETRALRLLRTAGALPRFSLGP